MKDSVFDRWIKKEMEGLETSDTPQWEEFKAYRNSHEIGGDDQQFDAIARKKLKSLEIDSAQMQWEGLRTRMTTARSLLRHTQLIKGFEAMAFFFILFSISKFMPLADSLLEMENRPEFYASFDVKVHSGQENADPGVQVLDEIRSSFDPVGKITTEDSEGFLPGLEKMSVKKMREHQGSMSNEEIYSEEQTPIFVQELNSGRGDGLSINKWKDFAVLPLISTLAHEIDRVMGPVHSADVSVPVEPLHIRVPNKRQIWLNVFASFDHNIIHTPDDPVFLTGEYINYSTGHTIGAAISKELGRQEWSAGISYSKNTYQPGIMFREYVGSFPDYYRISLTQIESSILSLPFEYRFGIFGSEDWNIEFRTGFTAHFVASAAYRIAQESISPESPELSELATSDFKTFSKMYDGGILDGGSLANNTFVSLKGGLSLERHISDQVHIFFAPEYSHTVFNAGFGPNDDQLNRISFNVGIKYALNNNRPFVKA